MNEFGDIDMEAFYASLESSSSSSSKATSSSHFMPSEETKKKIQILKDLFSKDFSLLLHPGRSIAMKDTLKHLRDDQGFSSTTKSEIIQLLNCFVRWSLEYDAAAGVTATTELVNARNVMSDLEANVKEFNVLDQEEQCLANELAKLEEEMINLEKKIKSIKNQIANSVARKDRVANRKIELFHKGKVLKAKGDRVRIRVPRLKAEQDLAKRTRALIEEEWSQLRQQFIQRTGFKDYWV